MAVKIRLRRMGAKKAPFYRVVVADSRFPRDMGLSCGQQRIHLACTHRHIHKRTVIHARDAAHDAIRCRVKRYMYILQPQIQSRSFVYAEEANAAGSLRNYKITDAVSFSVKGSAKGYGVASYG